MLGQWEVRFMILAEHCMRRALALAAKGRGTTAPNPCVGAVLERDGVIVAEGWHTRHGGPHAEVECLAHARSQGVDPASCTLYVTLEPCNHHGRTPPCTQAVLAAGITTVVVGCADPNPHVIGGGAAFLRDHGVDVTVGVLESQCQDMIADFLVWQRNDRPYVTLKLAMTLDGRIAARGGRPEAVSGPESHRRIQDLRAYADAVLVGGGTLRADNPRLTWRPSADAAPQAPRMQRSRPGQPLAVVATTRLPRKDDALYLLQERPAETIFLTSEAAAGSPQAKDLRGLGCRVWGLPGYAGGDPCDAAVGAQDAVLDLASGLSRLRRETGAYYLLCEGGGHLAMHLLGQGLADEIRIFLAPRVLGDAAAPAAFAGRTVSSMTQALALRFAEVFPSGHDMECVLRPTSNQQEADACSPA